MSMIATRYKNPCFKTAGLRQRLPRSRVSAFSVADPGRSCAGTGGTSRPVLQSIQDQGCRDGAGQPAATNLAAGLNLDLEFPPAYRCGASAGDEPALMQDAHC
jgi:hypothetical protein